MSKPTWPNTFRCSATSAFFISYTHLKNCVFESHAASGQKLLLSVALFTWSIEMLTILVVILILMLLGALPSWNYSRNWGYAPSGGLGLVVLVLVVLLLMGRI